MNIVRATSRHLADAAKLLAEYYESINIQQRDTRAALSAYLSDPSSALWIAYDRKQAVGCVALRPLPHMGNAVECKRLYVCPAFRGRRIADALMDALEAHAGALSVEWIYLDSKDDLATAIRLYRRRGYVNCERYNQNPQATLFLRKPLRAEGQRV